MLNVENYEIETVYTKYSMDDALLIGLMPGDEEEEPDEEMRCVVCMSRRKSATIVHGNTGHICCCMQCALTLWKKGDKCPICRAPIDNVIRHFTS